MVAQRRSGLRRLAASDTVRSPCRCERRAHPFHRGICARLNLYDRERRTSCPSRGTRAGRGSLNRSRTLRMVRSRPRTTSSGLSGGVAFSARQPRRCGMKRRLLCRLGRHDWQQQRNDDKPALPGLPSLPGGGLGSRRNP
jgi:hypothetical protein